MKNEYDVRKSLQVASADSSNETEGQDSAGFDAEDLIETVPDLRILDMRSPSPDKTTGFNPYDTVVLHNNRRRKTDSD